MNPFRKLGRSAERIKQKATGSGDEDGASAAGPVYVCTNCEEQYDQDVSVCLDCDGTEFVTVE